MYAAWAYRNWSSRLNFISSSRFVLRQKISVSSGWWTPSGKHESWRSGSNAYEKRFSSKAKISTFSSWNTSGTVPENASGTGIIKIFFWNFVFGISLFFTVIIYLSTIFCLITVFLNTAYNNSTYINAQNIIILILITLNYYLILVKSIVGFWLSKRLLLFHKQLLSKYSSEFDY